MTVKKLIALLLAIVLAVTPMMGTVFAEEGPKKDAYSYGWSESAASISDPSITFDDTANHWAKDYIAIAALTKYMNGVGNQKFAPNDTVSRAMVAQVLYNLAGKPAINGYNPFKDVKSSDWYYKAVCWAYNKKITTGTSNTTFDPNAPVTREQMVTFLFRYVNFRGYDLRGYGYKQSLASINKFSDKSKISGFAMDAIIWALSNQIINGKSSTSLAPKDSATRAELAKIIVVFAMTTSNKKAEQFSRKIEHEHIAIDLPYGLCERTYSLPKITEYYKAAFEANGFTVGERPIGGQHIRKIQDDLLQSVERQYDCFYNMENRNWTAAIKHEAYLLSYPEAREELSLNNIPVSGNASDIESAISVIGADYETYLIDSLLMQDIILSMANKIAKSYIVSMGKDGITGKIHLANFSVNLISERWTGVSEHNNSSLVAITFEYLSALNISFDVFVN